MQVLSYICQINKGPTYRHNKFLFIRKYFNKDVHLQFVLHYCSHLPVPALLFQGFALTVPSAWTALPLESSVAHCSLHSGLSSNVISSQRCPSKRALTLATHHSLTLFFQVNFIRHTNLLSLLCFPLYQAVNSTRVVTLCFVHCNLPSDGHVLNT